MTDHMALTHIRMLLTVKSALLHKKLCKYQLSLAQILYMFLIKLKHYVSIIVGAARGCN